MAAVERPTPTRTCVACRTRRDKAALVRVVRRPGGQVELDATGTAEGRGAYLCADGACWATALKRSALQRALRTALPEDLRGRLERGDAATGVHAGPTPSRIHGGSHGA